MQFAAFETEGAYQPPDDLKTLSDNQRSQLAGEWVCVTESTGSDTRYLSHDLYHHTKALHSRGAQIPGD